MKQRKLALVIPTLDGILNTSNTNGSEMQTLYCLRIKNEAVSDA